MRLQRTPKFRRAYRRLSRDKQQQVDAHLRLLAENLRHPSLQARRWSGTDLWYARINRDIRVFFEVNEDHYLILDVGHHDIERNY